MTTSNQPSTASAQTVGPAEARELMSKAVSIDVRTPAEFESVHIEGSKLHSLSDLDAGSVRSALGGRPCLLICRSGTRAGQAAEKLAAAGLADLHILEGGISAWAEAGLPVQRGRATMSLERQVRIAAGALVFIGAVLSVVAHPWFIGLPAFVGAGLVFAGITDTCGMGMMLARMPWNQRGGGPAASSCRL